MSVPTTDVTFASLGLNATTLAALHARGFKHPTPIQREAIPLVRQGEDLIGQAQTGTGKTAAFGLPIIENTRPGGIQTVILAPTRELANQIVEEMNLFGKGTGFKAHAIYGGVGFGHQINALRRGDITCLVACPGRLLDLLQRGDVRLGGVREIVLDEADRMLDMGFIRDIDKIFRHLPARRQTLLFSATMPNDVRKLADRYLRNPEFVRAETGPTATELTDQFHVFVRGDKFANLLALYDVEKPAKSVIFTRTKHGAKRLAKRLAGQGYKADALQGNLSQNARDRVMAAFRANDVHHLVATDVAARGLDVNDITHVINFDFPTVDEDYVHRIGRTGRAGKRGRAFILIERGEERDMRGIERASGIPLTQFDLGVIPAVAEATPVHDVPPSRQGAQQHRQGGGGGGRGYGGGGRGGGGGGGNRGRRPQGPSQGNLRKGTGSSQGGGGGGQGNGGGGGGRRPQSRRPAY